MIINPNTHKAPRTMTSTNTYIFNGTLHRSGISEKTHLFVKNLNKNMNQKQ